MNVLDVNTIYRNKIDEIKQRLPMAQAQSGASQQQQIDKDSKLYQVSQEFEAIFIKQMLNTMRETIDKSGLIDGGYAEEIFEDMLYDEYAQQMAETAEFGLADSLYMQLAAYEDEGQTTPQINLSL